MIVCPSGIITTNVDRPFGVRGQNGYQVRPKFLMSHRFQKMDLTPGGTFCKPKIIIYIKNWVRY